MNSFAINAYGEVGICIISQQDTFSVRGRGVRAVGESLLQLRMRKRTRADEMRQLPNSIIVWNVSAERRDRERRQGVSRLFLCHVAHLRAAVIGSDIPAHGDCEFCASGSSMTHCLNRRGVSTRTKSTLKPGLDLNTSFQF